jgi:dephospho-CoA kinase
LSFVVGLTGGIGSGKTVASDHFAALGVPVIDTDIIARLIVEPGQPALQRLVKRFGNEVLKNDGTLNRAELRTLAFANDQNKAALDAITHPAIRFETASQISKCDYPYCIVVIPLLTADSAFAEFIQQVLTITANHETKVERVKKRSGLSRVEVERIMDTQLSDQERSDFADDIIANDGTIAEAQSEVERLHQLYLNLSQAV